MKLKSITVIGTLLIFALSACQQSKETLPDKESKHDIRQDYFAMRAGDLTPETAQRHREALREATSTAKSTHFQSKWKLEGPLNINGRVNVLTLHPNDKNTWLVGESTGGIFKTTDAGQSYTPVFDQFDFLAISEIVYHPKDANIVFAGTGDENISGYPFSGDGLYKSTDGGDTWSALGLAKTGIISTLCIHPNHPDTMWAASMGVPFVADSARGVYRTYDGGITWEQVLLPDTTAGVIDMMLDHNEPNTIYAASWNRVRNNSISLASGSASKLWISKNGGDSWQTLTLPSTISSVSRIGLDQSRTASNKLYATVVNAYFGLETVIYSNDQGTSWQSIDVSNISGVYSGFGWYFGQIRVNPYNVDKIYIPGVTMYEYNHSTQLWKTITATHVDHHDLDFISEDSIIASTDGGLYLSTNGGGFWSDIDDIPSTQFYRIAFNPYRAGEYWGGLQDNGTVEGNHQGLYSWNHRSGGDGFQAVFDRDDSTIVYVESQNGYLSYLQNGWGGSSFTMGIDPIERRSWDMPIINDKNNHMYTGTYRVYKNVAPPWDTWMPVSIGITDSIDSRYHVITALGVSEVNTDYVYAGTSDGRVWNSPDAGTTWNEVTSGLPDLYVTSLEASPSQAQRVYAGHSGYRDNIHLPHIHRSDDLGANWTSIAGDMPDFAVNAIVVIPHHDDSILFAATDGGVYGTLNAGTNWHRVGTNMPIVPVYDLVYDSLARNLVAGTFARGMHSIPADSLIPGLYDAIQEPVKLASLRIYPNPAQDYIMLEWEDRAPSLVQIMNMEGKLMGSQDMKGLTQQRLDIADLEPGVYFIRYAIGDQTGLRKFIKL